MKKPYSNLHFNLHPIFILHSKVSENAKHAAAQNFTRPRVILRGRVTYLIKSKFVFKLIIDRKLKLL